MTNTDKLLREAAAFARDVMQAYGPSHDWSHVERVRDLALALAEHETADKLTVELAALLHDVDDHKFSEKRDPHKPTAPEWLRSHDLDESLTSHVIGILEGISFRGEGEEDPELTVEGDCVRDADRLEALGAIGIARAISYGGGRYQTIHDPNVKPIVGQNWHSYRAGGSGTTFNHFHEKTLLIKNRIKTAAGRRVAEKRHLIVEEFLQHFEEEWNGADWQPTTSHP